MWRRGSGNENMVDEKEFCFPMFATIVTAQGWGVLWAFRWTVAPACRQWQFDYFHLSRTRSVSDVWWKEKNRLICSQWKIEPLLRAPSCMGTGESRKLPLWRTVSGHDWMHMFVFQAKKRQRNGRINDFHFSAALFDSVSQNPRVVSRVSLRLEWER